MHRRSLASRALPLVLAASAAACGGSSPDASVVTVAKSGLARDTSPNVSDADRAALSAGNAAFALDLYGAIAKDPDSAGKNLFFSPYSVSVALAMTYAGANGATATQMATALHFTLPSERLHPAFDWLDLQLTSRGQGAKGSDGQPFQLHVANSLWVDRGVPLEKPFLDTLAVSYGAGAMLEDFQHDFEGARQQINGWVSDQTAQKIQNLLTKGTVSEASRFVLVDAIYFDGAWASPFDKRATTNETFHAADGSAASVPMMQQSAVLPYAEGDGWQAAALPYDGDQLSMLVVVPKEGSFASFESTLTSDTLSKIAGAMTTQYQVVLSMPKFELSPDAVSLKDLLKTLGMQDAFNPALADFSGITTTAPLAIGDVIQKAFIRVDENGTEAAAATAAVGISLSGGVPTPTVTLTVDRPFLFAIRDNATGTILFLGREMNP